MPVTLIFVRFISLDGQVGGYAMNRVVLGKVIYAPAIASNIFGLATASQAKRPRTQHFIWYFNVRATESRREWVAIGPSSRTKGKRQERPGIAGVDNGDTAR